MSRIRLYFDEDAMQSALVVALRARRVDVLTASDCEMIKRSDEEHLRYSTGDGRVWYSFNIRDYSLLHQQWIASGHAHSGIILAPQQRYSVGQQLRRLLRLLNRNSAEDMLSRLEYLSAWGVDRPVGSLISIWAGSKREVPKRRGHGGLPARTPGFQKGLQADGQAPHAAGPTSGAHDPTRIPLRSFPERRNGTSRGLCFRGGIL